MNTLAESNRGDRALRDLSACQDGRRILVRELPRREVQHPSGVTFMNTVGAGELVALDPGLAEIERLDVEGLVVRHGLDPSQLRALRTVHDPRGWAFALQCRDRIMGFGFGEDEQGLSRTGEAWQSFTCGSSKQFSDLRYHPSNGDLVFAEEAGPVQTSHASIDWPDVSAFGVAMDDEIIAAIGPKFLYIFDRRAGAERVRLPQGPGYSVCLLPDSRVAVLAGKKPRLRVFDRTGTMLLSLEAQVQLTARLTASPSGVLTLVANDRLVFVDAEGGRVATLPNFGSASDTQPGLFAWLDSTRAAVVWPGTARISVLELGDVFSTLPAAKWKREKLT